VVCDGRRTIGAGMGEGAMLMRLPPRIERERKAVEEPVDSQLRGSLWARR